MKIYEITRKMVKKALRTEDLKKGMWVESSSDDKDETDCEVCAVGAVLRHLNMSNSQIHDQAAKVTQRSFGMGEDWEKQLKKGNFLGALSIYFEDLDEDSDKTRDKTIKFVKKHFPKRFYLIKEKGKYRTYVPAEGEVLTEVES